jgi:GNAT acetyltransferase-like protein
MEKIYTFKEVRDKETLKECFRFRYKIYAGSLMKGFLKENAYKIDIDYFDVHSRHYALLQNNNLAGYIRTVLPKDELLNYEALEIGKRFRLLNEQTYLEQNNIAPFPFLSYNSVPKSHWDYFHKLERNKEKLVEASRLVLHPQHRTIKTSKFLTECAIVIYLLNYITQKHAVINCYVHHSLFFRCYGFKSIDETGGFLVNGVNKVTLALNPSIAYAQNNSREKLSAMTEEYKQLGKLEMVA